MVGMPFNSRLWVWGGGKSLLAGPKAKAAHFAKASTISFPTKPTWALIHAHLIRWGLMICR